MIGIVHPGAVGSAVGHVLVGRGPAVLVSIRATARELGVEDDLLTGWALSLPGLPTRSQQADRIGRERGWRWAYEMAEVGRTFRAAGQPEGFGAAAAEVFERMAGE